MGTKNEKFELSGINHLALVCKDMARTVDFYTNVLGMPLVKTIDLPMGMGQHFFFDCGGGDCVAFFWFPDAPAAQPGIASAAVLPGKGDLSTAHAFDVALLDREEDVVRCTHARSFTHAATRSATSSRLPSCWK